MQRAPTAPACAGSSGGWPVSVAKDLLRVTSSLMYRVKADQAEFLVQAWPFHILRIRWHQNESIDYVEVFRLDLCLR